MRQHPDLGQRFQTGKIGVIHPADLEHVVRADNHAVALRFATTVVDDWLPRPGRGVAAFPGTIRVLGSSALLGQCFAVLGQLFPTPFLAPASGANPSTAAVMAASTCLT